jgi:hypothetical protein
MKIHFLCPRWGSESLSPGEFLRRVVASGYDGVEVHLGDTDPEGEEIVAGARDLEMPIVLQHAMTMDRDLAIHIPLYTKRLRRLAGLKPLFINTQSGRDLFTLEENLRVFDAAALVEAETGIPLLHETHRARCLHTPWRTSELLRARPSTRLALDLSHWCNVCESLLGDQEDLIAPILPAVEHIHARVGWAQGPQVNDPRAPEWSEAVEAHLKWWDRIIGERRAGGASSFTITPEFGPPPYLPVLPHTREPLSDQWAINIHMMDLLRKRYAEPEPRR